jgi:hypothetical protein
MPELPRQIRLAAGDYFMHGQDLRMRQAGLPGNVCCAVIKLGNGFDVERLRRRIAESPIMDWLARARIFRPVPMLFPAVWRTSAKSEAILFEHQNQNGVADQPWPLPPVVAARELHAGRGPGLAFDVMRHADGTAHLFLSWNHTHLDARGLDLLLNHLNSDATAKNVPSVQHFLNPKQRHWDFAGWWPNVKKARGSVNWLRESGKEPLFSLVPPGSRPGSCRSLHRVVAFSPEETARIDARCQQFNLGFRRSHFYLAASVRALHTIAVQRGNRDGAYLIPVPHDTRRRGASGPIFSNHLSILFYRIEPKLTNRLGDILGELSLQMTNQIRDRFPECCMAALDMFKPLPLGYYVRHLGRPTRGKIATLCFSDSGETCTGMTELWGGKILDVAHLVPSWRPPGLTLVFLRFNQKLIAHISWVDDCMSPAEVDGYERSLRAALLAEEVA